MKILTTYPIPEIKKWQEKMVLIDREPKKFKYLRGLFKKIKINDWWLPIKLLFIRNNYDMLFTGSQREDVIFAFLQSILPGKKIPHIMIDCLWKKESNLVRKKLKHFLLSTITQSITTFVVWSTEQINYYHQEFGIPKKKLVYMPFHSTLYTYKVDIKNGDYIFAGGNSSRDYTTLIEAIRDLPIRLVIALNDKSLMRGIDIPPNVTVATLSEEDYLKYMAASKAVVVPMHARIIQGAGQQTYLNAMTFKKPVIVSNVTGVNDYLENYKTAIIVKPEDIEELRKAIIFVLNEEKKVKKMVEESYKLVTECYTVGNFVERNLELINKIASPRIKATSSLRKMIKNMIFAFLYYSGLLHIYITFILKKRKNFPTIIVNYHSFVENLNNKINAEPTVVHKIDNFKKELKFIKRYFDIVSLDRVVNYLKNEKKFTRPTIAITVDDGLKDNFDLLLPVVKSNKIPLTIFLTASLIGTNKMIWTGKFAYMLSNTKSKNIHTCGLVNKPILSLNSIEKKRYAYNTLLDNLKEMDIKKRDEYLKKFENQLAAKKGAKSTMLDWEQIRQMGKTGITFGAHTCTHPILTKMPLEGAKREIADSKRIIEEKLGTQIKHFAYPNGRPQDFNEELREFCKNIGFESISTCDFGHNSKPSDAWALKRMGSYVPISVFAVNVARIFSQKIRYKIPAIVLGMTVNGLGVVRSLARNGVPVYALGSYKDRPAMKTRYAKCYICPDVQKDPQSFKNFLLNLARKIGGTTVLLPTSDAYNEFVNTNRKDLEPHFKFAMSPKSVMDQLLNKKGQYLLAKKFDIPIPETYFPKDLEKLQKLAPKLKYPVILKGLSTGKWRKKFGDKKAVIANSTKELLDAYISIHDTDNIEPIIQEIIKGDDTHHYKICAYMDRDSNPLLTFTLQKIRQYPCDFGIGSSVISAWEPKVAELGLKYLKKVGYLGVGSIEFKKDMHDGKFKMIEINPRLWAQNSLPEACGQNFAFTAYLDILGEKIEPKKTFKEGIKWIAFKEDRASFNGYHTRGRMSWRHWIKSILTGKRVWAIWTWDDPMPFLKSIKFGYLPFEKVLSKIKKKNTKTDDKKGVSLEIIKDFDKFLGLRKEWNELLDKSDIDNPFLRHEWISSWWRGYGEGKELCIVCFKKAGQKLIGFAPLMKYKTKLTGIPIDAIGFIANHWVGMDIVISDSKLFDICLNKLQNRLNKEKKIIILSYFNENSNALSLLRNELKERKITFKTIQKTAPYIRIQGSWEAYLKDRTYLFRAEYKKKKKMIRDNGKFEFIRFTDNFDVEKIIKELGEVSTNSWQGKESLAILSSERGLTFYQDIIKKWLRHRYTDISLLRLNNKVIAYLVGFRFNGHFYVFDTAYDERFKKMSPGMVIHNMLLEQLFSEDLKIFDFGYIADYKKRWTEKTSTMTDLTIFPKTTLGKILSMANRTKVYIHRRHQPKQSQNHRPKPNKEYLKHERNRSNL